MGTMFWGACAIFVANKVKLTATMKAGAATVMKSRRKTWSEAKSMAGVHLKIENIGCFSVLTPSRKHTNEKHATLASGFRAAHPVGLGLCKVDVLNSSFSLLKMVEVIGIKTQTDKGMCFYMTHTVYIAV